MAKFSSKLKGIYWMKASVKSLLFLSLLLISLFYFSRPAEAHFIETDGSILTMLHAAPDDNPIIGQPATLTFYITDSDKKFKISDCDCRLTISLNNTVVFSSTKPINNGSSPSFSYIFSKKGIYSIQFTAKPLSKGSFQDFYFHYDMRVDRTSEQASATKASTYRSRIILVAISLITILLFLIIIKLKKCPS